MPSYKIEKEENTKKLDRKVLNLDGYSMKPKLKKRDSLIEVRQIIIINPSLKEKVLKMQFNIAFRRLLKIVMSILDSEDTSDGDIKMALTEIEHMKSILKDKYRLNLTEKEYNVMWRKATLLETKLKKKKVEEKQRKELLQKMMEQEQIEERGRGR